MSYKFTASMPGRGGQICDIQGRLCHKEGRCAEIRTSVKAPEGVKAVE